MIINIVGGSGIMGEIHKPIFEAAGHSVIISGRNSKLSIEKASQKSDITIISVPLKVTENIIKRVAPYCKAIIDFSGLKEFPIKTMLKYSSKDCEVAGLHPLYGKVNTIKGKVVVYCKTPRTGKICREIIQVLSSAGALIYQLTPKEHDKIMAVLQNSRVSMLDSFANEIINLKLDIKKVYALSPPPTKLILDIISRQVDKKNDELYQTMEDFNPHTSNKKNLNSKKIRNFFRTELKSAQERVKKIIS